MLHTFRIELPSSHRAPQRLLYGVIKDKTSFWDDQTKRLQKSSYTNFKPICLKTHKTINTLECAPVHARVGMFEPC